MASPTWYLSCCFLIVRLFIVWWPPVRRRHSCNRQLGTSSSPTLRILTNRQSAVRSKERKAHYISQLEKKVKALQTEEITLSTLLMMAKSGTTGLMAENNELKVRLQSMEEQIQLQVAVNNILKDEVQRLGGTENSNGGRMTNDGAGFIANQEFYPYNNEMCNLITTQQLQQLQIRPPLQPSQVQCQPPNLMRNEGLVAPNHMELDLEGFVME